MAAIPLAVDRDLSTPGLLRVERDWDGDDMDVESISLTEKIGIHVGRSTESSCLRKSTRNRPLSDGSAGSTPKYRGPSVPRTYFYKTWTS